MKRKRPQTVVSARILLAFFSIVVGDGNTTLAFAPDQVSRRHRVPLYKSLFYAKYHQDDKVVSTEANLIQSIRQSRNLLSLQTMILDQNATPNVAAAALRRTTQYMMQNKTAIDSELLSSLLETVGTAILSKTSPLSMYALSDVLSALLLLSYQTKSIEKFRPLAQKVWNCLTPKDTPKLGPSRLTECLRTATIWELKSLNEFYESICQRLTKGDALSKLTALDLTYIVVSLRKQQERDLADYELELLQAVSRRLRKQAVRRSSSIATLTKALQAATQLWRQLQHGSDEVRILAYTLAKDIVIERFKQDGGETLEVWQASQLCETILELELDISDALVVNVQRILGDEKLIQLERASMQDTHRIMNALQYWHANDTQCLGRKLGRSLYECVEKSVGDDVRPWQINSILRGAVLLYGSDESTMKPFLKASERLFLDDSFLRQCGANELSNFVWFMYKAHWRDDKVLTALASRILESDIVDECSPKMACRVLSTSTAMCALSDDRTMSTSLLLLPELFSNLGEHLLSTQLTPLDISSAIYAYAKADYFQDMGIVDHLVDLMASRVEECKVRQIAQSLWACGKMVAWESDASDLEAYVAPPYYGNSISLATHLASRSDELSTKDVAQSLWAVGRLQIDESSIVTPLAERAKTLSSELTAQELANILWALSKVNSKDFNVIYVLTQRLCVDDDLVPSPQEAASILYALGRMDIRHEEVFSKLSTILMEQIDRTSALTVANVLWAHRTVHIAPPQTLLDSWAKQKLGIVAVHDHTKYDALRHVPQDASPLDLDQ